MSMRPQHFDIASILSAEGVISRRQHPELAAALSWLVRKGALSPVLPGVYARSAAAASLPVRLRAIGRALPDAVVVGEAAAWASFWPTIRVGAVTCAVSVRRSPQPGVDFVRRRIPPELVVERKGLRLTGPALTALDLCDRHGGDGIDQALRSRAATLPQLHRAMAATPGRAGNAERRRLLLDSRDQPWSAAERRAHRLLREAGITGWVANLPVQVAGLLCYLDIAFRREKLAVEIDGRLHEDDPAVFEHDRERQNALVLDGWRVLRFTWAMLVEQPERVVALIRAALADRNW